MKNSGINAWKARIDFMRKDFPFSKEGVVKIKNEEGRLHADNEPAWKSPTRIIWYKDGRRHGIDADIFGSITYYYENIRIPTKFYQAMKNPDLLTVEEVLRHPNAEVKYVGVKIIGYDKIKGHKNCKIINTCKKTGMELFKIYNIFADPVCILKVINSTPELDGTFKDYFLTVPPTMKTAKEAVAWTFRMEPNDYAPSQET